VKWKWAILLVPVLYLLAINPWFMPDQHDDVLYFYGAKSIAEQGIFAMNDAVITDWPPGLSALISLGFHLGLGHVVAAKVLIVIFVMLGVVLIPRYLEGQGRSYPYVCTALTALFPISFMMGTRVLSEWPFLTLSVVFLLALERLRVAPSWRWALVTGLALAAASLTRYIGVFLGVAVLWQWWMVVRAERVTVRGLWRPEVVVGLVGGGLWMAWRLRCQLLIAEGLAEQGNYARPTYFLERFTSLDPILFLARIEEVLCSLVRVAGKLGAPDLVGQGLAILLGLVLCWGCVKQFRKHGVQPVDVYVGACLFLLLLDLVKPSRYFMPLAPFLCSYVLVGLQDIFARIFKGRRQGALAVFLVGWGSWLGLLDVVLLFKGNTSGIHSGLSMMVSPTAKDFYQGKWADLYAACEALSTTESSGPVAVHGEVMAKYVLGFGQRTYVELPRDVDVPHEVLLTEEGVELLPMYQAGWDRTATYGSYIIYRKQDVAQ
jgi:hypothetical protein